MSKPGRNDPCYCGSGKKYKKCHMAADKEQEKERRRLADAARWLRRDLLKFAREERFAESFAVALPVYWNGLYTFENAEQMSENEAFRFIDWFVFDFQLEDGTRLLEIYHQEQYDDLTEQQKTVIDTWMGASPSGAYEFLNHEGQILHLRDFVTGEELDVFESGGRGPLEPGDLLLGRPVPIQDHLEFSTVAAYLPQDEIADLSDKIEEAKKLHYDQHPDSTQDDFMRQHGFLIIHHALEQAEINGRPPVAASDPDRQNDLARKAAQRIRKLQKG
ncbi:MAG: SEC-C domain-containing protein [Candidatus Promineifilaceae bacterium]